MQVVIVAGGGGSRLWPLSTKLKPKQFVPLIDEESLLLKTYKRIRKDFDPENIWVATIPEYVSMVKEILPDEFIADQVIAEPEKRDTFGAICGHAAYISHYVGFDEPMSLIQADHFLPDENSQRTFNQTLRTIARSLENGEFDIIALAVKPTYPSTLYGYIQIDEEYIDSCSHKIVPIKQFKEKPDFETAQQFVLSGNYMWNVCPSSFTYNSLRKNIEQFQPDSLEIFDSIAESGAFNRDEYLKLPKTSFDYAIAEHAKNMGVATMHIQWEDVGSWDTIRNYLPEIHESPNIVEVEGKQNKVKLLNSEKKVAFVGVSNLLLVETEEGILVIDPFHSSQTKKVAEYFESSKNQAA